MSKSEAIHIGSLKGTDFFSFWGSRSQVEKQHFQNFWVLIFSLNINSLYELNFIPKLHQIEQTLNCWRHRNLSPLGKVTVIKSLLLPQLLYIFSCFVLIFLKSFFKKLNHLFFKFIWNWGNDRVKRDILCNDYEQGGLRMFDLHLFSYAQKSIWVKQILDPAYSSFWKNSKMSVVENFHPDWTILFRTDAPDCILNTLCNCQLIETIKLWYLYKSKVKENLGWSNFHLQDPIWWIKMFEKKSKKFFSYTIWDGKGILHISDLFLG